MFALLRNESPYFTSCKTWCSISLQNMHKVTSCVPDTEHGVPLLISVCSFLLLSICCSLEIKSAIKHKNSGCAPMAVLHIPGPGDDYFGISIQNLQQRHAVFFKIDDIEILKWLPPPLSTIQKWLIFSILKAMVSPASFFQVLHSPYVPVRNRNGSSLAMPLLWTKAQKNMIHVKKAPLFHMTE